MVSFDFALERTPQARYCPEFDPHGECGGYSFEGIRALAYEGAELGGKRTRVFAHIGFPADTGQPVPAVVLVHGGGGHPEDRWIRKWTREGFAAISMDTTGYFPQKPVPGLYEGFSEGLERKLPPALAQDGYTVGPDNKGLSDVLAPIGEQWMYHAVAQIILAHNLLRADSRIDREKIGICGISWGGVLTSIAIGHDPRFAFAVPIYGSGYLGSGLSGLDRLFRNPAALPWLAETRFPDVKTPVMWLGWNDDCCFSIHSNSLSYLATCKNHPDTCLSMLSGMGHSHYQGFMPRESYWFAHTVLGGRPVPKACASYEGGRVLYGCTAPVREARLYYIREAMTYETREKYGITSSYMKQEWETAPLDPRGESALLPEEAFGRYVEFTLENGIVLTTPYLEG